MNPDMPLTPSVITQTPTEDLIVITDPSKDRYQTFSFISWWKQEVVRDASVMVVGAGALGNEVLKNLALMGVGHIFVVDFDTIEDANLSRSILYRRGDNGKRKAEVAAERVREINSDVKTQFFHGDLNYELGLGVFRRMDAIIGCLDNRAARLSINRFCWNVNKPWIDGAIQELLGVEQVFMPNSGACYECTLKEIDYEIINLRFSCPLLARNNILQGKVPTTPTISSIIAGIETQDALKLLHGMEVQAGKGLVFNGLINDVYLTEYPVKEDCPSHWIWSDIVELEGYRAETTTLEQMLERAQQDLGQGTVLEFVDGLGRDFLLTLDCKTCGNSIEIMKPLHLVDASLAECATCGGPREPVITHTITGTESFLSMTLKEFGIPALHIVAARNGLTYRYYELTGDAEQALNFR